MNKIDAREEAKKSGNRNLNVSYPFARSILDDVQDEGVDENQYMRQYQN